MKRSHCYISRAHKNKFREIKSTSKNWIIFAISKSSKREREREKKDRITFLCSCVLPHVEKRETMTIIISETRCVTDTAKERKKEKKRKEKKSEIEL